MPLKACATKHKCYDQNTTILLTPNVEINPIKVDFGPVRFTVTKCRSNEVFIFDRL